MPREPNHALFPTPPHQTVRSVFPEYGFPIIFFQRLSQSPAWPSGIVSSEITENFSGVFSISAISIPSFLQKHDKGIAPSLLQGYVVLAIPTVLRATPTPLQTSQNFGFPYIYELPYCMAFVRVSRATPYGFLCVSPLLPRKSTYRFWQFSSA